MKTGEVRDRIGRLIKEFSVESIFDLRDPVKKKVKASVPADPKLEKGETIYIDHYTTNLGSVDNNYNLAQDPGIHINTIPQSAVAILTANTAPLRIKTEQPYHPHQDSYSDRIQQENQVLAEFGF